MKSCSDKLFMTERSRLLLNFPYIVLKSEERFLQEASSAVLSKQPQHWFSLEATL